MTEEQILFEVLAKAQRNGFSHPLCQKSIHYLRDVIDNGCLQSLWQSDDFFKALFRTEWNTHQLALARSQKKIMYLKLYAT